MNDSEPDVANSPSRVGNFVIAYSQEIDIVESIQPDNLIHFLDSEQNASTRELCDTDTSFFPRAFTESEEIERNIVVNEPLHVSDRSKSTGIKNKGLKDRTMAGRSAGGFTNGFQPDVIMSNSHQRSGPDGSPALVPATSQGFSANLSETGELFAPVRTLTFSDIDQSSHIEDSYVNDSRLVSTPNKSERKPNSYDYSSMHGAHLHNTENDENAPAEYSDSSDSDNMINGIRNSESPEFRQLEGEADNDLTSTGPFHPSAHGLSKEFMDNFVGKTGNQAAICDNGDIFSPLGSNHYADRQMHSITPPLHSPGPNSPYARKYGSPGGKRSPRVERSPRGRPSPKGQAEPREDPDEIQFAMSPTKTQPDFHPFDREILGLGEQNGHQQRQDFDTREKFYFGKRTAENSFKPIEKQPHSFNPATIPKNLNEYFEQVTSDHFLMSRSQHSKFANYEMSRSQHSKFANYENEATEMESRQGDGTDNDLDEQPQRLKVSSSNDDQFSDVSPSAFEKRYLQRTQVSVKLPQATYDTISANSSHDEKFASGDQLQHNRAEMSGFKSNRAEMSGFPPDVTASGADSRPAAENATKSSPGKVMDLLQNQVTKKDNSEEVNDGSRDKEMKHNEETVGSMHTSAKSRDTNDSNLRKSSGLRNDQQLHSFDHRENSENPDNAEHIGPDVENDSTGQVQKSQSAVASAPKQNNVDAKQSQSFQASGQSQLPVTSRLLQETVSQRNKTTQKFVSSAPGVSKPVASNQNKEFKKPFDVAPKSQTVACSGARKTLMTETCPKFKVSDKTKPKSVSTESLNNKQRTVNQSRNNTCGNNGHEKSAQSRYNSQTSNQSVKSQGNLSRGQQAARGDGHNGSIHSVDDESHGRIVTQVETTSPVPVEQPRPHVNRRQGSGIGDASLDIKGMDEVRQQLQGMMRMSYDHMSAQDRSQYEHSDIIAGFGVDFGEQHRPLETSWNLMRKPGEEDLMENFQSFSSQYFTDSGNVSRSDASVHAENQRLRDMLEKERYRRKHCEQYIQQLNVKLLETQQQVAVAVSTDKRKDIMIEQLDKQLARVMEGWKKRDQEKDAFVEEMQKEKEEIENNLKQQQEMISNFEHDMSAAVDALRQEKENAAQNADELREKIQETERSKSHVEELLDAEKEKVDLMQQECDNLRESRETLDKKLDQMQRRLHREQDDWFQREQELLQRIEEVSEKSNKILQAERAKNEEQGKLAEEIMDQYQAANTAVKKLEMELDAALREKESIKVEMGIMEAKFENAQRVLEADMHSTMEKQIAEQIADVQRRHEKSEDELREKHREQMLELSKKNGKEMERQLSVFREEMQKKEEEFRKQLQELEARLAEYRTENADLKISKQKLESTRLEILTKLQYAMQTQWNEALCLLSATPQRKQTQSRIPVVDDDAASVVSAQTAPSVNFSLCTPNRPPTNQSSAFMPLPNQNTPPRGAANQSSPPQQSANQQSPSRSVANQFSPVLRHHALPTFSPGGESMVSHSTEKDHGEVTEASIETAAMSHLKQFHDYMNSFTKTPEWIASINSQAEASAMPHLSHSLGNTDQVSQPRLPSPPELAALLSTHLHNIQQQHLMPNPHTSVSQSGTLFSQPNSILSSQKQPVNSNSASLPPNLNFVTSRSHVTSNVSQDKDLSKYSNTVSQSNMSHLNGSIASETTATNYSILSEKESGTLWEGAPGMSRAVPLHPPQQGQDPYMHDDQQSKVTGHMRGYFQGGQSFSPPTKQNKDSDSLEDLTNQSDRLNEDYSQLSERLEQHGSHQEELQHYIQMLLHRSPGEVTNREQNDSMFSQDNEELDLNDTAQAAQLQRELDRIQELRQKQGTSNKQRSPMEADTELKKVSSDTTNDQGQNRILSPEQLAEVTKLLNHVKGQGQTQSNNPQVTELLELLKHAQLNKGNHPEQKKGARAPAGNHCDRHKATSIGIRRNVQFNPVKGVDSSKTHQDGSRSQQGLRSNQQKKVERKVANTAVTDRKVAGSATKGEKGSKPAAWK
ncbi:uncharacterized protein LOC123554904 isoform X2 [Mercenaria mercenaria]|uniref:uncharacterized protein LOC123554904 isoform X2 n=1 Tax=Mercenaria mercenaria TaxID=6596 RepID=UPI00234E4EE9|nr:uncharacterized protein LOC123554904 isoform X2 [Mercenaria mercenaria]